MDFESDCGLITEENIVTYARCKRSQIRCRNIHDEKLLVDDAARRITWNPIAILPALPPKFYQVSHKIADAPFLDAISVDRYQGWALRAAIGMRRDDTEALRDPRDARGDDE